MFSKRWLYVASLLALPAFAQVSFEEKIERVKFLEELSRTATTMNIEAYHRELHYEKLGLSLEARAENESDLLSENIKNAVVKAFEASLNEHGNADQAAAEIREQMEKDLSLMDESLREEIRRLALQTLADIQNGSVSTELKLQNVQQNFLKNVQDRSRYFNEEAILDLDEIMTPREDFKNKASANRSEYKNKNEVISALVSDEQSASYISSSSLALKSEATTTRAANVSFQVKAEFLGVGVAAGPVISFKRNFKTIVDIQAEGLNPVLLADGNFDFYKRDSNGNRKVRAVSFVCDSSLEFESDYAGGGGFSVAGIGASATVSKKYTNKVGLSSRRIAVPQYIDEQTVTLQTLINLCHRDFLKAKISNNMTIESSLNIMMKNVISSLRFSHPKSKCATDNHCINWYNRQVLPIVRAGNFPRCVEEKREKFFACELRGLEGQNCTVIDKTGKRISDGMYEFTCDTGLRCVQVKEAGWFRSMDIYQYAKGKCMPINPRTYKSPLKKGPEYIEVYLAN